MGTLIVTNCSQLVTLAGPKRARRGGEMRELAVIPDGAMLVQEGRVVLTLSLIHIYVYKRQG